MALQKGYTGRGESPIRRILIESALIVFSILGALAVSQWNDGRKQHALTERVLRSVRDEMTANKNRIEAVRPYHTSMETTTFRADSLRRVRSYTDFKAAAPEWSGFSNPPLESTAWQSAITVGVVTNVGYDTVKTLSGVYELQSKVDAYASNIGGFDFDDRTMPSTVRKMWVYFATVRTMEDSLTNRYVKALTLLGQPAK